MGIRFYGKTLAQWRLGLKNIFDEFLFFQRQIILTWSVPYEVIRHKVLWENPGTVVSQNIFDKFLFFQRQIILTWRVPYEDIRHKILWETLAFGTVA